MIDTKNYSELKLKMAVSIVKAGTAYAVSYKKFDPNTGEIKPSEVLGVNMKEIDDKVSALQAQIDELKAFKADCLAAV